MSATYRTTPAEWSPGYLAVHIYDDSRFSVVIDGRPVFSGTGYHPGPSHDDAMQVADLLAFAYWRTGGGALPVRSQIWPDDLDTMREEIEEKATH
jgi:hypothetical protein